MARRLTERENEKLRAWLTPRTRPGRLTPPFSVARAGTVFFRGGGILRRPPPPPANGVPPPPPPNGARPLVYQGRSLTLVIVLAGAAREIAVTPRIGFPFQVRRLTLTGDLVITDAASFRILAADDDDTTATPNPTGRDLIEYYGDLIGTEDPGVHLALSTGPATIEPWYADLQGGKFLKVKLHLTAAVTRRLTVTADLDDLSAPLVL